MTQDAPHGDPEVTIQRLLLAERELTVTTRHTDALAGKIGTVDTKANFIMVGLGVILTILLSTYAATAYFMWRMVTALLAELSG